MLMRCAMIGLFVSLLLIGCSDLGDSPVDPVPTLNVVGGTVTEGEHAECLVQLSFVPKKTVTFDYSSVGETAVEGADFQPISGTGTIDPADGEDHVHLHVVTLQDTLLEPPKTFRIVVTNVVNADVVSDTAQCAILDDDGQPSLSVLDGSAVEGEAALFNVTINKVATQPVTFTYFTSGGTALSGTDYTAVSGTDTIPVGQTFVTVSVPTIADGIFEPTETFTFTVSGIQNAQVFDTSAAGTIESNDPAPVTFSADVKPLLSARCSSCHIGPGAEKGYQIDSYTNVINSGEGAPQVIPGNSASSRLYNVLAWTPGYPNMPQGGSKLSATELKKVKDWIDQGALDN